MKRLHEEKGLSIKTSCRLFGHCRQAYYQKAHLYVEKKNREQEVVTVIKAIREEDPGIGARKIWLMMNDLFSMEWIPGRDRLYSIMRANGLIIKTRKTHSTTNSNHRFHKYKNLIKGLSVYRPNQLWVSDITYIELESGCCYLHMVTDAYSHKIIGWVLSDSLSASATVSALQMAIAQAGKDDLSDLIHHSDRGIQYCCNAYVNELNKYHVNISMTEDYKPTDNAIAERVNGIIKNEYVYRVRMFSDIEEARVNIGKFITFYNERRPHGSIGNQTPSAVHTQKGMQKRTWKNYYKEPSAKVSL